jgi:transglutaminase-like putative cysteine protease
MRRLSSALLVILLAAVPAASEVLTADALGPHTVRYTYEARVTPPAGTRLLEMWLPLPREDDQQVRDLGLTGSAPLTTVRLGSGDRAAYLRVTDPKGPLIVTQTATVARREVRVPVGTSEARLADVDATVYTAELASTPVIVVNDEVRRIAREETAKKATVVAKARALYDWVFDHMQYDKSVPGWGLGDIPYCLKVGKGNCTDFHSLFIALARTSGIPARWNIGFPLAYGDGRANATPQQVPGYHCWAEFYAPGAGWVPVDISEARKHPELKDYFFGNLSGNRVLMTRGRDLLLEPDGTGRRLNYFAYPIARADGLDVAGVEWTFRYTELGPSPEQAGSPQMRRGREPLG